MRTTDFPAMICPSTRSLALLLVFAVISAGLLSLSACNTTAGVGRDVQKVGRTIERGADRAR